MACRIKVVWNVLVSTSHKLHGSERTEIFEEENKNVKGTMETASGMVVAVLGNYPLCAIFDVDDKPAKIQERLGTRFLK